MIRKSICLVAFAISALGGVAACAQDATFATKSLTPETALIAAKAALEQCRKDGYQVAVAVVDRAGLLQVLLRDRFAGAHTIDLAPNKAWTAVSFRIPSAALGVETQAMMRARKRVSRRLLTRLSFSRSHSRAVRYRRLVGVALCRCKRRPTL